MLQESQVKHMQNNLARAKGSLEDFKKFNKRSKIGVMWWRALKTGSSLLTLAKAMGVTEDVLWLNDG